MKPLYIGNRNDQALHESIHADGKALIDSLSFKGFEMKILSTGYDLATDTNEYEPRFELQDGSLTLFVMDDRSYKCVSSIGNFGERDTDPNSAIIKCLTSINREIVKTAEKYKQMIQILSGQK